MTDAIEAYNASLEAMAAACEGAERSNRQTAQEYGGWPEARDAFIRSADHLRDAAARLRSQMLRPIEDAPKDGTSILVFAKDEFSVEWSSDGETLGGHFEPVPSDAHFLPLPQIGDSNE